MKKIGVFVDVQNIYYTTRDAFCRQFNYRELWRRISEEGEIVVANAYAIQRNNDKQIRFQQALMHLGFTVKLKPYIQRRDGSAKGDWDVGITIDALDAMDKIDELVLLSGDGDFNLLLDKVKRDCGICTTVCSVHSLTAQALIDVADRHIPISADLLIT